MRAASAQIFGKCLPDLRVARVLVLRKQGCGLHDHAVDAITALHGLFLYECSLQRMRFVGCPEAFEGDNALTDRAGDREDTGAHRHTVDMHGASTALSEPTAEAWPMQSHIIAQRVQ